MGDGWTWIEIRREVGPDPDGFAEGRSSDSGRDEAIKYEALTRLVLNGPNPVTSTETSSGSVKDDEARPITSVSGIGTGGPKSPMASG